MACKRDIVPLIQVANNLIPAKKGSGEVDYVVGALSPRAYEIRQLLVTCKSPTLFNERRLPYMEIIFCLMPFTCIFLSLPLLLLLLLLFRFIGI